MSEEMHIPADLTELDQWVLWRLETRNGKPTKVPYQTNGHRASSTDASTWTSYEKVWAAWRKDPLRYQGIGFVFGENDPYAGIDLDNSLDSEGRLKPWAQAIAGRFWDTYTEISPSGRGVKIWARGSLPGTGKQIPWEDGKIEVYDRGRYFTVTGRSFNGAPLQVKEHQADLNWLYDSIVSMNGKPKIDLPEEEKVTEGRRHDFLVSLAARLRTTGMERAEILAALRVINQQRCEPPKPDEELRKIAEWISTKPAGAPPGPTSSTISGSAEVPDLLPFYFNDHGNALRLIALYGQDLRYCYAFRKWLGWDRLRWQVDETGRAQKLAKQAALEFLTQAVKAGNADAEKFAKQSLEERRIQSMLGSAECELPITPAELDRDVWLLNCLNGTLNLQTGELRPHRREDFITKLVHYEYRPDAECPLFLRFLARVMGGGPDASEAALDCADRLIGYLQKAFGYALTGVTSEKAVFVLHGSGNNGKTTMLSTFLKILEEYAVLLQIDTLMVRQESNNTQADLADLRGARFVMTSETEEGQRLAEGKLKRITQGMGKIKAVRKYENPIEFPETHKLFMDANHKPHVRGSDSAIWNRLHPIPFTVTIPPEEIDPELPARLLAETEGILAWAVAGTVRWRREGLGRPPEVEAAGAKWREESDPLREFVEDCCVVRRDVSVKAAALWQAYQKWAEENRERHVLDRKKFADRLQALGCQQVMRKFGRAYSERGWVGIALRVPVDGGDDL